MATLFPGQSLLPGQTLQSDYGVYTLTMQSDGNVVLRNNESTPLWRTGTGGGQFDPRDFIMQTDGNLVLYDTSGQPRWASKTQGNPGAFLNVQDDGNLVVYRAGSTSQTANNALWSSGTNVPPPLTLQAVVDNGAMLNVGDANLSNLSYNMLFNPNATSGGMDSGVLHRAGLLVTGRPRGCGGNPVTVNANIDRKLGPQRRSQLELAGLAGRLRRRPRGRHAAASNPTEYAELQLYGSSRGKMPLFAWIPSSSTGDTTYPQGSRLPPTTTDGAPGRISHGHI